MKRLLAVFSLLITAASAQVLPNLNYNGLLNATCSNANTACSNAVFVNGLGSSGNPGSMGSGAALDIPVANYNAAVVTVSGTYAGSTINFETSDPGGNYFQEVCARTDINLLEISEVVPTNQVRAWNCPVWAGTRFRVRQSAYTSGNVNVWITLTQAAIDPSLVVAASIANVAGASDPCQDVSAIKQSSFANITTATSTPMVAASGSTIVYVCSVLFALQSTTTANTILFNSGTGGLCTSPTVQTATYSNPPGVANIATFNLGGGGATVFKSAAGQTVCALTSVGSTPLIGVSMSYVQQ